MSECTHPVVDPYTGKGRRYWQCRDCLQRFWEQPIDSQMSSSGGDRPSLMREAHALADTPHDRKAVYIGLWAERQAALTPDPEPWAYHPNRSGFRNLLVAIVLEAMWLMAGYPPDREGWLAAQAPGAGSWVLTSTGWEPTPEDVRT